MQLSTVDFVIEFEAGNLDEDDVIKGFQNLINQGIIGSLQGFYGRTAQCLIDAGLCTPKQEEL